MAAGNFYIRKNASDASIIGDVGNISAVWDTLVYDEGSIVNYSSPNLQLDTGIYLIMYSEYFISDSTTNNERIEIQGEIHVDGVGAVGGYGQDYIRKSTGIGQECTVSGQMILDVTSDNTDVFIYFYRTDTSQDATGVHRVGGFGGVTILELDSTDNYGFYSNSSSQTLSGNTEVDIVLNTNDQQDTGFSRTGNAVTISNAGRYLAMYSMQVHQTGTGREDCYAHLEIGTTKIAGSSSYTYSRGDADENCDDGALTWIGIIDVSASDVITARYGSITSWPGTIVAGTLSLQFWQIPSAGDECIVEATTGDFNAPSVFSWDTQPHIDTGSFTYTNGNSNVEVDQHDHLLAFATVSNDDADAPQRSIPRLTFVNDGNDVDHASGSVYHRNTSSDGVSVTVASIIPLVASGTSIEVKTEPLEATGTMTNDSGQFSILSLESIWDYSYAFPASVYDVDTDDAITNAQTNVVVTGAFFEAAQGTGKVELVENSNYTGTKITQSIDSWSDTSIQFDTTAGVLADTKCYLFVTTDGASLAYIQVIVGNPPETYQEAVEGMSLSADHYWMFQNSYDDEIATATADAVSGGTPTFSTDRKIVKGDSHSLQLDNIDDYISPVDQSDMNTSALARRYIGGWIQLDSVSQTLSVIYEEGAQVNNMALLNGFGNNAMFQIANAADDYVQTYVDKPLTPNRPYHFLLKFHASAYDSGICKLFVDGVLQSRTNGNPWETTQLDSHSGNITWGHEGTESLKVGDDRGVDATTIAFVSPTSCNYAHWYSWSDTTLDEADDIRVTLFEKGAVAEETVSTDTEANMQTSVDALSDTLFMDWPCSIEIGACSDVDFELTLDNITFEDRVSLQIRYMGIHTLTLVTENGTALDTDKLGTPYNGSITIINAPAVTIYTKDFSGTDIQNARVLLLADAGGDLAEGTTILTGLTDVNGKITTNHRYTADQPVTGLVRKSSSSIYFVNTPITGTITSDGLELTAFMIMDE